MVAICTALLFAKILPVDDGAKNASFVAFRKNLKSIIAKKDGASLLKIVDKKIEFSFGGEGGYAQFKQRWGLDDPKTSPLWKELGEILAQGSSGKKNTFCVPYYFAKWPENYDPFEYMVALKKNMSVLDKPNGKKIASISYDVVKLFDGQPPTTDWAHISTPAIKSGFVKVADLGSPISYRAYFEKKAGSWKMTVFIAGD